ncbi:hypothetical protein E2C01_055902 [Portunus trituberculatus]|uniref:Uncharacterized protein n=1 Tax=Portunus trituberculatus TaxID=210409 RepID=A0A5B7GWT5_PORTR|nr:hypothetical protein [Portunus trituberculatus]
MRSGCVGHGRVTLRTTQHPHPPLLLSFVLLCEFLVSTWQLRGYGRVRRVGHSHHHVTEGWRGAGRAELIAYTSWRVWARPGEGD